MSTNHPPNSAILMVMAGTPTGVLQGIVDVANTPANWFTGHDGEVTAKQRDVACRFGLRLACMMIAAGMPDPSPSDWSRCDAALERLDVAMDEERKAS